MSSESGGGRKADLLAEAVLKSVPRDGSAANAWDGLCLLMHASMLVSGFRFIGVGSEKRIDAPFGLDGIQALPADWNATSGSFYSLRYSHGQSAMEYVCNINRMGPKAVILGLAVGDDRSCTFQVDCDEYISTNFFPYDSAREQGTKNMEDAFKSKSRAEDFLSLFKFKIIGVLAPNINKEGYEQESQREPLASTQPSREIPHEEGPSRLHDPSRPGRFVAPPPQGDIPVPEFEDELRMRHMYPSGMPGPFSVGHDDLNPAGLGSGPVFPGPAGGGGMHPTPDHPMFGPRHISGGRNGPASGMHPPGARYDPVGPGDTGGLNMPGRRPFGGGGFHNDDEPPPEGYNDMFM